MAGATDKSGTDLGKLLKHKMPGRLYPKLGRAEPSEIVLAMPKWANAAQPTGNRPE